MITKQSCNIQWNISYPDTSVPKSTVRITEYPDKWITFSVYGDRINEASQHTHYITDSVQKIEKKESEIGAQEV